MVFQQLKREEHDLARQRADEEHERARRRQEELVQLQLQSEAKKQAMRRAADQEIQAEKRRTDENRAKLERANMESRIAAESKGRIEEFRKNQDIHEKHLRIKGDLDKERVKEAINTTFENLGAGLSSFLGDKQRITTTVVSLTALAAGVYFTREGFRVAGRFVEKRLGTPSLVRETSRSAGHYGWQKRVQRALGWLKDTEGFGGVVTQLIAAKADVNKATTADGTSPLYMASKKGHLDVARLLISKGADVNQARTDDGSTPLHIATLRGYTAIADMLRNAGATV